jgi:UDP-N-acetylmuramate dehydrogenase
VIIHSAERSITTVDETDSYRLVKVSAGVEWDAFVSYTVEQGLYGAENLSYIPGEVGASAIQNPGAYGAEAKDIIDTVHALDTQTGAMVEMKSSECAYGYRDSLFKHAAGRYIITGVTYRLSRKPHFTLDYGPLRELAAEPNLSLELVRNRVIEIRRSKLPEPDEQGSAGSFFKNPVVSKSQYEQLQSEYPTVPGYHQEDGSVKVPAGWLIEQAGLKGATHGGAMVYPRQCLVIVNTGNATGSDVLALSQHIQSTVADKFNIALNPEVNIIG